MCNRGKSCSILQTIPTQQIQTIPTEVDGSSCPHNTDQLQTLLRGVMLQSSLSSCSPRPFRNSACETSVEEPRSHRTRLPGKVQTCSTSAHPSDAQGSLSAHSGDGVAKPPPCPHPPDTAHQLSLPGQSPGDIPHLGPMAAPSWEDRAEVTQEWVTGRC